MTATQRYITRYLGRQRNVVLIAAIGWITALLLFCFFLGGFFHHKLPLLIVCNVGVLFILGRALHRIFRRASAVSIAMEIESREPAFDQRLITVLSHNDHSPMIEQLRLEVDAVAVNKNAGKLVSLRPMIAPWVAVLIAAVLLAIVMRFGK